jgi:hypothetical protein
MRTQRSVILLPDDPLKTGSIYDPHIRSQQAAASVAIGKLIWQSIASRGSVDEPDPDLVVSGIARRRRQRAILPHGARPAGKRVQHGHELERKVVEIDDVHPSATIASTQA